MYDTTTRLEALRLLNEGWSLNAASKALGISRAAIRDWRDHGTAPRGQRRCCFICDNSDCEDPHSYAVLLGYYLGDGCVSRLRRTYSLRISCDERYPGIISDVTTAIGATHPVGHVCQVKAPGVVVVQNCWNHWPCVLPQHGPGRKHERHLGLEGWQREILDDCPSGFVRGLFHSDGSRTNNWTTQTVAGVKKRYDYPRWQFVNHSAEIRTWCTEALDLLDIPWRQSNWKTISVSTRAGVGRLDEVIGRKR